MARISSIQLRRDTAANWTTANSVLNAGEAGFESDTGKLKVGDGSTAWSSLGYVADVSSPITTWAASTAYERGDLVAYNGIAYRRIANGTSASTFDSTMWNQVTPTIAKAVNSDYQPSTGLDIMPRFFASGSRAFTNGTLYLTTFTPTSDTVVSNIITFCTTAGTDTGGTTTRRMGLFTVDRTNTQVTLVARTNADATLWTTTGSFQRALSTTGGYPSSYTLLGGVTYAVGCLAYNTGGVFGAPTLTGNVGLTTAINQLSPFIAATFGVATDLPTTATTVSTTPANSIFARLT
jgi:hypothetical protein